MKKSPHCGNRDDIGVINIFPLASGGLLSVFAYNGLIRADGGKEIVQWNTGETDLAKAQRQAEEFVAKLKEKFDALIKQHGGDSPQASSELSGSVEHHLDRILSRLAAQLGPCSFFEIYRAEISALLALLGPRRAAMPPDQLTPQIMKKIRDERLRCLDCNAVRRKQCLRMLRYILRQLPGLAPECLATLRAPRRKKV
ncbi:MAG: hypothetical protein ABSE48_20670 [Verrucomicrobiota bacterium]|jgi:hypothetical protein